MRNLRKRSKTKGKRGLWGKVKGFLAVCLSAFLPQVLKLWNLHDRIISILNMPQEIRVAKDIASDGYQACRDYMAQKRDPNSTPCAHPEGFEIAHPNLAIVQPVAVVDDPPPNAMALRVVQMNVHAYVTYPNQVYQQQRPFNPALLAGLA